MSTLASRPCKQCVVGIVFQSTICNLQSAILLFVFQSAICNLQSAIHPSSAHAQESKAPLFTAHAADGSNAEGTLLRLGEDWSVTLGGDKAVTMPGADLIGLQRKA